MPLLIWFGCEEILSSAMTVVFAVVIVNKIKNLSQIVNRGIRIASGQRREPVTAFDQF
jgi:hypothetical protein